MEIAFIAYFSFVDMALISAVPPEVQYCFYLTIVVVMGAIQGLLLGFSSCNHSQFMGHRSIWVLCQKISVSIPTIYSEPWEITLLFPP